MSTKQFKGVDIKEVWDYRLSSAVPTIYNFGETWLVAIYSKDDHNEPLEVHDTNILCETGDTYDTNKIKVCYEWLYSVRDKYALIRGNI